MLNQLYINCGLGHLISVPSSPASLTGYSPPEGFEQHSHVHRNLRLGQELEDITLQGDYELWVLNRYIVLMCFVLNVFKRLNSSPFPLLQLQYKMCMMSLDVRRPLSLRCMRGQKNF